MYLKALSAEILKLKRTLALWLAIIIPSIIALLQFSIILFRGQSYLQNAEDPKLWLGRQTIFFWTFLALPLFITLETALLAGLALLKPDLGFNLNLPWIEILKHAALAYVGSLILIVLHTWVGLRWHNFVVAMSFGISMTVFGLLLINADWARFYPWTLPALILNRSLRGSPIIAELLLIGIGSVFITFFGGWIFTRRDVL